jgi:hypothetical protein
MTGSCIPLLCVDKIPIYFCRCYRRHCLIPPPNWSSFISHTGFMFYALPSSLTPVIWCGLISVLLVGHHPSWSILTADHFYLLRLLFTNILSDCLILCVDPERNKPWEHVISLHVTWIIISAIDSENTD